jgi:pantetheine-phosphate adenylyltransferase
MSRTDRIALCPGTFDPVTYGHLDVIRRSSAMFDEVIVSVVNLPWRKGRTLFSAELEMNQLNRRQDPQIESVYLMASAKYSFLSSSGIKELATFGGEINDLVPEEVAGALKERLGR